MSKKNYINLAKKAANIQIKELKKINKVFNKSFIKAIDLILNCKGKVIFAGVGKSESLKEKLAQLFPVLVCKFFVISKVLHGDMGQIEKRYFDYIFLFWKYLELTNMLKYANRSRIKIISIKTESILLKAVILNYSYQK